MENKSSITARMSAFARAYHAEAEARPVFRDTLAKALMPPEEYDAVRGYLLSGAAFFPQAAPHAAQNRLGSKKGAREARAPLRSVDFDNNLFIAPRGGRGSQYHHKSAVRKL